MTTFKKISGFELTDIHVDDLRKMQTEIEYTIASLEREKYNKLFQNVIKAIEEIINAKLNDLCFEDNDGRDYDWCELRDKLTEYHHSYNT